MFLIFNNYKYLSGVLVPTQQLTFMTDLPCRCHLNPMFCFH